MVKTDLAWASASGRLMDVLGQHAGVYNQDLQGKNRRGYQLEVWVRSMKVEVEEEV